LVTPETHYPAFRARSPWWGGDLQTLRNTLRGPGGLEAELARAPTRRLWLALDDGSGDELAALLQLPAEPGPARPLVVLVHGLGGDETSVYMQTSAAHLLGRGHPVLRLNLRGAGPSRERCRFHYHAGKTEDLRAALTALIAAQPRLATRGLALVGYSLGGNLVLKFAGEGAGPLPVRAVVSISAPLDLAEASRRFLALRNRIYHWNMLRRLRSEATAPGAELTPGEREAVLGARTLYEFDDRFVAPRAGFSGADEYYARCSSLRLLPAIELPTLALHALDDPWIPARPYLELEAVKGEWGGAVRCLVAPGGGHVGFHARRSGDSRAGATARCWHDRCIVQLLETVFA
jgi:predicted alpha/beta-fold hydrolase